jgi:hypothetical protein
MAVSLFCCFYFKCGDGFRTQLRVKDNTPAALQKQRGEADHLDRNGKARNRASRVCDLGVSVERFTQP